MTASRTNTFSEHYKVVVIGAGPAGTGVLMKLACHGIEPVLLIERNPRIGGISALYPKEKKGVPTFIQFSRARILYGEELADWLKEKTEMCQVDVALDSQVTTIEPNGKKITFVSPHFGRVQVTADAVVMACGAREKNATEKGWITGSRPAQVYFTRQILELKNVHDIMPIQQPVVMGSDILAYAAAAKLQACGSGKPIMLDEPGKPRCSIFKRLYFLRWSRPKYVGDQSEGVKIVGRNTLEGVQTSNAGLIPCDGIVLSGELVPNSELMLSTSLEVDKTTRKPIVGRDFQMSEPGWFSAGNMIGGEHGAEWCYFHGRRVARAVERYLSQPP